MPVCNSNSKHVKTSTISPINTISLKEEEEQEDSEEDEENKIEKEKEEEETEDKTVEDEDERVVKDSREIGRDSHLSLMDFTVQYDTPMKDTFQLEVLISQALHLPRLSTPQGWIII